MNICYEHDDDHEPTPEQTARTFLSASEKGRSSAHGDLYHKKLAILMILRGYKSYQIGALTAFIVSVEVEKAGKFDDIMFFYQSSQANGTCFIQAKHKQCEGSRIEKDALCTAWDAKTAFSIPMYFASFLEIDHDVPNNSRYVLCTNAALDKNIKRYFKLVERQHDKCLQFGEDLEATCYQFNIDNPFPALTDTLKVLCLSKLATRLAKTVCAGKVIKFDDTLVNTFADFIYECVEELTEGTSEPSVSEFLFKQHVLNADESTSVGKFRETFRKEYTTNGKSKHNTTEAPQISLGALKLKIDKASFASARSTGHVEIFAKFGQKVDEFYRKFVLMCNALNEGNLGKKAMTLLPDWCDAERATVLDKLQVKLSNAMNSNKPVAFDLRTIQSCFVDSDLKQSIRHLKHSSAKHLNSLHETHPHIKVHQQRLEKSPSYAFLKGESDEGVREFNSLLDVAVSCLLVTQMLSLLNYETLFVTSSDYTKGQDLRAMLNDVLAYVKDVNHPTIKVITIVGKHSEVSIPELNQLSAKYRRKIVVVEKMIETQPKDGHCEHFFGKELTDDAWSVLFAQPERKIFGTATKLCTVVRKEDNLSLLLDVLKLCDPTGAIGKHHLNELNYDRIKSWYVQRQFEWYQEDANRTDAYRTRYVTKSIIERVIASKNEEPKPPVSQDEASGKVFIFLNDAGHGKSSYFIWLSWRLSAYDPSLFVVMFNAIEYSTDFDRLKLSDVKSQDSTALARLLYRYIHLALYAPNINNRSIAQTDADRANADRCAELIVVKEDQIELNEAKANNLSAKELVELRLFRAKFNERKLVLVLDGFDEIAPDYKDVVMNCFAQFDGLAGVRYSYLSSRPYGFQDDLSRTFKQCNFYQLKPFSAEEAVLSWHKFLQSKIDGYGSYGMDDCVDVLTSLYSNTEDKVKDIVTVPLLLHMVQTILLPEIEKRVKETSHSISFNILDELKLDKYHLLKRFVDQKLNIYHTEKSGTNDAGVKTVAAKHKARKFNSEAEERHMLLAVYVIFNGKDRKKLLTTEEQKSGPNIIDQAIKGDEKIGFVLGVVDGIPRFVHRMFAEYFAAQWLYNNRTRFREESIFQSQAIWTSSLKKTRYFFDCMLLNENNVLHMAVLNESHKQIQNILRNNPSAVAEKDEAGRLPIHLGIITMEVWEKSDRINAKDDLFKWNLLEYAFVKNEFHVVHPLLSDGVAVNIDNLCKQLFSNDTDVALEQGIKYISSLENHKHVTDAANELCERVAKHLINEKKVDIFSERKNLNYSSVLEYCVIQKSISMLHQLIIQSGEQNNIAETCFTSMVKLSMDTGSKDCEMYLWEHYRTHRIKWSD